MTRSRYSLPNNPTASPRTRSSAIQPPIKKTRLSTDTKPSLYFEESDTEEDQEGFQEEDNVGSPLPQMLKTSIIQTDEGVGSDPETTVIHPRAGTFETITAQELSQLPAPEILQESNREAAEGSPRDEDGAILLATGLVVREGDQEECQSLDITPEDIMQPDLSQNYGVEEDMQVEPSLDFEPEDHLPTRPVQNAGPEDYLQADEYETEAPLETPDRLRSSRPRPPFDIFMAKQNPSSTTERYSEYPQTPHVGDLDHDDERYQSLQAGNMDYGDDESDGDKDLNGATSEYDSAQESLDTEESIEFPLETKVKINAEDKENDDPNSKMKSAGPQSAMAMGKSMGKMKAIDGDELTVKDDEEEDSESMKKDVMAGGLRPKSKKRKLRQAPTVFLDEMDEKVDMYVQPARNNASKQLHRKQKSKSRSRMH